MNTAADKTTPVSQAEQKSSLEMLTADTLVYLVLALLIWGTWRISLLGLFEPGDDTGYWIGVAGSVMMLVVLAYPLRKHIRFAYGWGNIRGWFWMHIVLGILGPLAILLHSNFQTNSLNAAVALYSMLLVAGSGVAGRFIFQRVNRGLHGEQSSLQDLLSRAGLDREDARSRLAFAPAVEQRLKDFEQRELAPHAGLLHLVRAVVWLPLLQLSTYRQCVKELETLLARMAVSQKWTPEDLRRRRKGARKMVGRYLESVVRVAQFSSYSFLLSLWHVAHIPFVYVLILTALVHVYAVHVY
ncbi:hypothetical protein [Rhodoferax lacus]|nr:hypothetical protein [Rhodoferax lacus]